MKVSQVTVLPNDFRHLESNSSRMSPRAASKTATVRNIPTVGKPYLVFMSQSRFCLVALTGALWLWTAPLAGQNAPSTEFKLFGHITSTIENEGDERFSDFSLGEHDLFVTSKITPKISFLGETVVAPLNSHGHGSADFKVSMERARLKYEFREWLSVIVGKMHTPVNYWNDVYHHGRLFFPTIDRPRSFGAHVPIHTLGLRLQGQNIGKLRFGYDLVVGNGMSSNDVSDGNFQKSVTAAVHIKPEKQMRVNLSYYSDIIYGNMVGAHSGHAGGIHYTMGDEGWHPVDLDYRLYCFSLWRKRGKWEVLFEGTFNQTGLAEGNDPDLIVGLPTERSANTTVFLFAGHKMGKRGQLYMLADRCRTQAIDLHIKSNDLLKVGLGWQYEFSVLVKTQVQIERYTGRDGFEIPADDKWEMKFRVAYCMQ